ncbi:MAG: LbtU family siderophore porin [Gammaproteobacteria bacterium]|jgi:hypothetical protein
MRKLIILSLLSGLVLACSVSATVPSSRTARGTRPAVKPTEPAVERLAAAAQNANNLHPAAQVKKAQPKPAVDYNKILILLLAKITQNIDNPRPSCLYLLNHRLGISGLLDLDANYQNSYNFTRTKATHTMISVAKLNFDLDATSWLHAHAGLFASTEDNRYYPVGFKAKKIEPDEAYITILDLTKSKFYARFGKQYVPFGNYHRYPIFKTLTQLLSETRADKVAQIGYLDFHGIYYAVYAFNGVTRLNTVNKHDHNLNNGGAVLGYLNLNHPVGFDVGVEYLVNMADVGIIRRDLLGDYYQTRVAGIAVHGDIITGPFDFMARFVTAKDRFNPRDFAYLNHGVLGGARPKAASLLAGYKFKTKDHDSKFIVGGQWSGDAYNLSSNASQFTRLPQWRVSMAYAVRFCPHVILGVEFTRDRDYTARHGGTGRFDNAVSARASAYF